MRNWLLSSETLVYMWLEPFLSHPMYKFFQTMVSDIRSSMQMRPSNRKSSVCLTGHEINKTYSNMKIDCGLWTMYFFAIHLNLEQQFADYRENALFIAVIFKT